MEAKIEKIAAKEQKELNKWRKVRKVYAGYLLVMMALMCVVRALDEFASNISGSVQSWLVKEFIVNPTGVTYQEGLSTWGLISTVMLIFTILAVFYLALSDRFGRKKILVISVFGMAVGMLICNIARSLPVYLLGSALVLFFVATDVHGIYVMEIAPAEKRATFIQLTAVFGQIGLFLVALSRALYTVDEVLNWRMLYLIPGIIGLIVGIILIIAAHETEIFKKQRIEFLSKPYEARKAEAEAAKRAKRDNADKQGIGAAFKHIFSHKQTRGNMLATIPQLMTIMALTGYTESIMTTNNMGTSDVNKALLMAPVLGAAVAMLTGVLSDKIGRRLTAIITSVMALAAFVGFVISAKNGLNPYWIGVIYGLANGAFFRYGDTLGLQRLESVPTNIRAAVASAFGLIATVIALASGIILGICISIFD
ncbi:MAG: MFS transporter, partial [Clostridiales bacterium]|nr:MFS transporter [Clostridiales bacterium]